VLEHVNVPSYHLDPTGVRWLNAADRNIVGDVRDACCEARQAEAVLRPQTFTEQRSGVIPEHWPRPGNRQECP
jgi:hypothetical protein